MDVFGLEPVQATIIITILGVVIQVGLGIAKNDGPVDTRKLLTSAIIAIVLSFSVVATALAAIPDEIGDLEKLVIIVGIVATVAGIDQLVKNTGGAIATKIRN